MKDKNNKLKAKLPRGFKDNPEDLIRLRNYVFQVIKTECQKYGFSELETSTIEFSESIGKFLPDLDRPSNGVFSFKDDDEKWLSLRYDLTAPLARYVSQNYQNLVKPFKRYQSGIVWRNEKSGPGRYREFQQFDADVVGVESSFIDAELCVMVCDILLKLGLTFDDFEIGYWNRNIWDELFKEIKIPKEKELQTYRAIDKADRVGSDGLADLLQGGSMDFSGDFREGVGLNDNQTAEIMKLFSGQYDPSDFAALTEGSNEAKEFDAFENYLTNYPDYPIKPKPSVVRGLEYYTGMVFEAEIKKDIRNKKGQTVVFGSVAGGGRYDKLVSRFGKEDVPATGISIGIDRLIMVLEQFNLLKIEKPFLVIIANLDNKNMPEYISMAKEVRNEGIACEISYGSKNLAKQLKYCDRKGANIVIIAGDEELKKGQVSIKDLNQGKEISKDIIERDMWKESKAGQQDILRTDLIVELRKIINTE